MKKIIHVDNSEFFRKLVRTFLVEYGFMTENFSKGIDALEAIKDPEVGLIITGMSLSDMDGYDFIKRVIESPCNAPIIALTSNESREEEQLLHELGVKAHIQKSGTWQEKLLVYLNEYFL